MERRLEEICREASELVARGVNIIILSDRNLGAERAAMPSLLAVGAVHHHLVREGTRLQIGLLVETGEAREIHHIATLIGYGAAAVNPYLMFESLYALHRGGRLPDGMKPEHAEMRVIKAIGKGLLKILSKMGISTIRSYTGRADLRGGGGAQRRSSTATSPARRRAWRASGLDTIAREALDRHARAYPGAVSELLPAGRRLPVAPPRRVPRLEPGDDRHAPARGARRGGRRGRLRALRHLRERRGGAQHLAARPAALPRGRGAGAARRGGARRGDRQALQVGRHVARARCRRRPTRRSPWA